MDNLEVKNSIEINTSPTVCPACNANQQPHATNCHFCGASFTKPPAIFTNGNGNGRIVSRETFDKTIYKSNDLTVEEVKALYFDKDALFESGIRLYRINVGSNRFYYKLDELFNPDIFHSVTSFLQMVVVKGFGLIEFYKSKTKAEAEAIMNEGADYGTVCHILCTDFLINGKLNVPDIELRIAEYLRDQGKQFRYDITKWAEHMRNDIFAFVQWVKDYDVKALAVEIPLISKKNGTGGMLDIVCVMNDRLPNKTQIEARDKAQKAYDKAKKAKEPVRKLRKALKAAQDKITPRRINALVDIKSKIGSFSENGNRGTFYAEHELQLHEYRALLKENFPALKIQKLYNWSPKNWIGKPNYNLKDQTEAKSARKLKAYHLLHKFEMEDLNPTVTVYDTVLESGKSPEARIVDLKTFIQNKHSESLEIQGGEKV